MQGPWVQCPTCHQSTTPGYVCQSCGAMLPAMPMPAMVPLPYQQPKPTGLGPGMIVLIVVGILVAIGGIAFVGGFLLLRDTDSSSTGRRYVPGGGASRGTSGIGDEIEIDDSTWTIIDVKDMGNTIVSTASYSAGETQSTTGRFIRIHYKVVNDGKKQETLLDTPKIVDGKSREYGPMGGESEYVPVGAKTAILETLQPSMEKDFYTIIEVPADAKDLEVKLTGLGLLGDQKNVDIGM